MYYFELSGAKQLILGGKYPIKLHNFGGILSDLNNLIGRKNNIELKNSDNKNPFVKFTKTNFITLFLLYNL
jgi:hypothetical protein